MTMLTPVQQYGAFERRPAFGLILACILVMALWLRWPFVSSGMPFFYEEDEAHHFNRVVEMVKNGEWNPHYFHKPSLHFYLRMPVVAASFLWAVKEGHIRSVKEIRTRDPYGLAGYAFTASHPGIAKANRALSVLLSVASVALVFLILIELCHSRAAAAGGAIIAAVSPELVASSSVIGVDVPMMFFSLLTVYLGVRAIREPGRGFLSGCACAAGLAVSCKYNALPIMAVPFATWCASLRRTNLGLAISLLVPPVAFLAGSPFILASLPTFLDQFGYEIWHYGIAGHEGHTGEPGWQQLIFYLSWLRRDALGTVAFILALFGVAVVGWRNQRAQLVALLFPALFLLLMVNQRANFVRNMYVMIPFLAVCYGITLAALLGARASEQRRWRVGLAILVALSVLSPAQLAMTRRSEARASVDSRREARTMLAHSVTPFHDTAIAGELQLPPEVYKLRGISATNGGALTLEELYLMGFDRMLMPEGPQDTSTLVTVIERFPGEPSPQRVPRNPAMSLLEFKSWDVIGSQISSFVSKRYLAPHARFVRRNEGGALCEVAEGYLDRTPTGDHCWLSERLTPVALVAGSTGSVRRIEIEIMSPWPEQEVEFSTGGWSHAVGVPDGQQGQWIPLSLQLPATAAGAKAMMIRLKEVHSPATQALNDDRRRLGIAIRVKEIS